MTLATGTRLGRYHIRSLLGAGGMGEVYLADDTVLRRSVAIKVLAADYIHGEERLRRFEQEAYSASSLNHPNIVTIHEIGWEGGINFIATEYVDGESLRQHLRVAQMELREVIDVAIQVVSALTAAHEAGIVHRDIKPENIMLRRDGYAKVLDFGLAKLTDEVVYAPAQDTEAPTQVMIKTEPGRVMGTIDYMSPEQARGREVDARTDIFSLGVMLYEMVAGRRPFAGETRSDVLAAVLTAEPEPLVKRCPEVPAELNRIVNKSLRKDREKRYQSAKELLVDLKTLRQELEFEAKMGRPILHVTESAQPATTGEGAARQPTTARQEKAAPTTISGLFLSEVKSHPKGVTLALAVVALVMGTVGFGLYKLVKLARQPESFQTMRLAKLTSTGNVSPLGVTFSPDGKYVVYAARESGQASLWVRHVATSSNVQIVPPADVGYDGVTFSPDGSYVYYSIVKKDGLATLYQVPVLGGPSRKLIEDAGPVTFSPDGNRLGFIRRDRRMLMIANADGTGVQTLAMRTGGEWWHRATWSPDGRVIASSVYSPTDNNFHLVEVAVKDGTEKPIPGPPWLQVTGITWVPDGSGLVLSGRDPETKLFQIWLVSYPEGKSHKVTNDLNSYSAVSLTADGKTLATIQGDRVSNIWIVPNGDASLARKVTLEIGREDGLSGLSSTPDGAIVYSSKGAGTLDLWMVNPDGSNNRQLTFSPSSTFPSVTPDGRYIVFVSDRGGSFSIWRMDLDGRNVKQLTNTPGIAQLPDCSPDNKWVAYQVTRDQKTTIWKVSIDGGDPIQLTNEYSVKPAISPDGRFLACVYGEPKPDVVAKVAIIPFDGGPPARLLDLPNVAKSNIFRWTVDGLIYRESRNRVYNLWNQPLDVSPAKQLTDFKSDEIFWFAWSRDGKRVALARGPNTSDVVLIKNFR